jgi:hypothetical protein
MTRYSADEVKWRADTTTIGTRMRALEPRAGEELRARDHPIPAGVRWD